MALLKGDTKILPNHVANITLKLLDPLKAGNWLDTQLFFNFKAHNHKTLVKIFFWKQILLIAIYVFFLSIKGGALIHYF